MIFLKLICHLITQIEYLKIRRPHICRTPFTSLYEVRITMLDVNWCIILNAKENVSDYLLR